MQSWEPLNIFLELEKEKKFLKLYQSIHPIGFAIASLFFKVALSSSHLNLDQQLTCTVRLAAFHIIYGKVCLHTLEMC